MDTVHVKKTEVLKTGPTVSACILLQSATKLRRLCFYRRLSVHRGGVPDQVHTPPEEQTPPGTRYTPWSRHPPRARFTPQDQVHPPPGPGTPPRTRYTPPSEIRPLLRTVRIILECILVIIFIWFFQVLVPGIKQSPQVLQTEDLRPARADERRQGQWRRYGGSGRGGRQRRRR